MEEEQLTVSMQIPKMLPPPPNPAQAPPLSSHHYLVKLSFMDLSI